MDVYFIILMSFALGFVVGLLLKGINIHHYDRSKDKPESFNETYEEEIPPEHQLYIEKSRGFIE